MDAHEHTAAEAAAIVASASSKLPGVTHDHGEAVAITAAELQSAAALVSAVQTGTTRLQDFAVAKAEGYFQITAGRSGLVHFHHQGYFTDGRTLDAVRPEEIMYLRMPGGAMKLVGVMFLMPPGEPGPRIAGPLTAWHAHDNLCYNVSTGIVEALTGADGTCPAGTVFRGVTPEMMHVWLVNNPEGVFSEDMDPATLSQVLAARP